MIPREGRAFLEALAVGESGGDYTILYGGGHFSGFDTFPVWSGVRVGSHMTHAAGKYQFQPATWAAVAKATGLPDFSPNSQDEGAWWLAQHDYKRRIGTDLLQDLQDSVFDQIENGLSQTWTSLSDATFPKRYKTALVKEEPDPSPLQPSADVVALIKLFDSVMRDLDARITTLEKANAR